MKMAVTHWDYLVRSPAMGFMETLVEEGKIPSFSIMVMRLFRLTTMKPVDWFVYRYCC